MSFFGTCTKKRISSQVDIPQGAENLLNGDITVSDLMADGATVAEDGTVTATLHNCDSFKEFSSNKDEQTGHYFVFMLSDSITGEHLTFKKNGKNRADKKDMPFDRGPHIFRIEHTSDYFEVIVDDKTVITLKFTESTLE